ncbi:CD1375 family protein [Listeria ilorinensis]|nr:CD1375 family protein [Listeria ilorinensis]
MDKIYVNLIIEGQKEFKDVPDRNKAKVKELLEEKELGYLAE